MAATNMEPSVLVASACKQLTASLFTEQLIADGDAASLRKRSLPGEMSKFEHMETFEWLLDTKYYTAPINVCACKARVVPPSRDFADTVEAVIILFDPADSGKSFEEVTRWSELIDNLYSPALKLLVCESIPTEAHASAPFNDVFNPESGSIKDGSTRRRDLLLGWCLENEFELVELQPTTQEEDSDDLAYCIDTVKGSNYGFARVRSALKAHTWSNLRLKPTTVSLPAAMMLNREFGSDVQISDAESGAVESIEETLSQVHITNAEQPRETNLERAASATADDSAITSESIRLPSLLAAEPTDEGDADVNDDSFESLFAHLREAKNRTEGMSDEERRRYAEQVTCEFWRAIGGDEDEIEGGDSDEN